MLPLDSGFRILVCEDDADLQHLMGEALFGSGHQVEFASTGEQALERLELGGIHLLVLDLVLPGMSGHAVLHGARRVAEPPRILAVTGRSDPATLGRVLREGAQAHLVKPFRLTELIEIAKRLLEGPPPGRLERRAEPRFKASGSVRVSDLAGGGLSTGTLIDLSLAGAQVRLAAPVSPFSAVRIAVDGPTGALLDLEGWVAWRGASPGGFAHGLGFANVPSHTQERLRSLIHEAS